MEEDTVSTVTIVLTERSETPMMKKHVFQKIPVVVDETRFFKTRARAGALGSLWDRLGTIYRPARSTCSRLFRRKTRSPLASPLRTSSSCDSVEVELSDD